jgi:hypothetical protein
LDFYELPSIFDLIENIPSKLVWKTHIKEKLEKYWKLQVIEGSKDKSSLKHLDVKSLEVNTVHNIWINAGYTIISIMKASIKVKLLTGVYILQTTRSKFSNRQISASCSLCGSEDEDNIHFILNCPDLANTRKYYIDELKSMLYEIDHDVSVNIVNNDELFIHAYQWYFSRQQHYTT